MTSTLKIDFVSDIACPWCAVGLGALEKALTQLDGEVQAALHFQPFELNPGMTAEGEDIVEHLSRKYQITPEQVEQNQQHLGQLLDPLRMRLQEFQGKVEQFYDAEGKQRSALSQQVHQLMGLNQRSATGPVEPRSPSTTSCDRSASKYRPCTVAALRSGEANFSTGFRAGSVAGDTGTACARRLSTTTLTVTPITAKV